MVNNSSSVVERILAKPEYFCRPLQLIKRLGQLMLAHQDSKAYRQIRLPWGLNLNVNTNEGLGKSIVSLGLYDLVLSESIWRLCEPGGIGIDVGANIGYTVSIFARRLGLQGKVHCFEPHPELYGRLEQNISLWPKGKIARIESGCLALSDKVGIATLHIPEGFESNEGLSSLEGSAEAGTGFTVKTTTIDAYVGPTELISLIKMDVEGHELAVLKGGSELIRGKRVRHIIFEDHGVYPTETMRFLEKQGYVLYRLAKSFFGPKLVPPGDTKYKILWEPDNYLATIDCHGAERAFRSRGWNIYKS